MENKRLYFIDNMKTTTVILMTVAAAAMCYMSAAPQLWYVTDKEQSILLTVFVLAVDVFVAPLMFFAAGYFVLHSLRERSVGAFIRRKLVRIGIPWAAGSLLIAPPVTYIILASRGVPIGFKDFYTKLFIGPAYQQAQYWYLGELLAVFFVFAAAFMLMKRFAPRRLFTVGGKWHAPLVIISAAVVAAVLSGGMMVLFPNAGLWVHPLYILVLQPAKIPVYALAFLLGAWGSQERWLTEDGWRPGLMWPFIAFCLMVLYIPERLFPALYFYVSPAVNLLFTTALECVLSFSMIAAVATVFRRGFDGNGFFWRQTSPYAYGMYFASYPVVFNVVWAMRHTSLPLWPKFFIACAASLLISWVIARLLYLVPCFKQI